MYDFIFNIAFHRTGKPRGWLRLLLFEDGRVARPLFHRVVYKKSGRIRPRFAYWVKSAPIHPATTSEDLHQDELALQSLHPLEVTVGHWRGRRDPDKLLEKKALIASIMECKQQRLLVAVGHDNYRKVQGGVQLCIQREEMMAAEHGFCYLYIHPWHPLPRLSHRDEDPDCIVTAIINGEEVGACRMSQMIAAIQDLSGNQTRDVEVVIHHMLGQQPEQIADLVLVTESGRCIFWLHDFFSICPSYTLQRNTLTFCNAPEIGSNACSLCLFGRERRDHQARMKAFFKKIGVNVASPSEVTATFWQENSGLVPASITVIPHISLDFQVKTSASAPTREEITIGYLGAQVQHKGWSTFTNILHQHAGSSDYRFVVMSDKQPQLGEDEWVPVSVTAQAPTAMSDAVKEADVDIVLHWPSWPETFSFTTFEALAGTAYVLTNSKSGNVAAAVETTGCGTVLRDDADLLAFFVDGRAQAIATKRRAAKQTTEVVVQSSRMSYSLLEKV